jgi:hypothetical protein
MLGDRREGGVVKVLQESIPQEEAFVNREFNGSRCGKGEGEIPPFMAGVGVEPLSPEGADSSTASAISTGAPSNEEALGNRARHGYGRAIPRCGEGFFGCQSAGSFYDVLMDDTYSLLLIALYFLLLLRPSTIFPLTPARRSATIFYDEWPLWCRGRVWARRPTAREYQRTGAGDRWVAGEGRDSSLHGGSRE